MLQAALRNAQLNKARRAETARREAAELNRHQEVTRELIGAAFERFLALSATADPQHPTVGLIDVSQYPSYPSCTSLPYPILKGQIAGWAIPFDPTVPWAVTTSIYLTVDGKLLERKLQTHGTALGLYELSHPSMGRYLDYVLNGLRELHEDVLSVKELEAAVPQASR